MANDMTKTSNHHFLALCCGNFSIKAFVKLKIENAKNILAFEVQILAFGLYEIDSRYRKCQNRQNSFKQKQVEGTVKQAQLSPPT